MENDVKYENVNVDVGGIIVTDYTLYENGDKFYYGSLIIAGKIIEKSDPDSQFLTREACIADLKRKLYGYE